jgi:hypothetical protein
MPVLEHRLKAIQHPALRWCWERQGGSVLPIHPPTTKLLPPHVMKLADSYIDAQEGALLAQDAIAEWLDRYRLELDSETEQIIYEAILDSLKRADLVELK